MQYKLGRNSPSRKPALLFRRYIASIPNYPIVADYLSIIKDNLQMLGNDNYGDCVAVAIANERFLVTSALSSTPNYMNLDQVLQIYRTQNPNFPNDDNGMDMQTLYTWMIDNPLPDGSKLLGFAKEDNTNIAELNAAVGIFGCIQLGISVTQDNMDELNAGQEWDSVSSPILGGHAVATGGESINDLKIATWAQETGLLASFLPNIDEAWVLIWDEYLHNNQFWKSIDMTTFVADFQAITGQPFPVNVPTPAPTPSPTPTPTPVPPPAPVPSGFWAWLKNLWCNILKFFGVSCQS
jgi:hypothetical protein